VGLSWSEGVIEMGDKFLSELLKLCSANWTDSLVTDCCLQFQWYSNTASFVLFSLLYTSTGSEFSLWAGQPDSSNKSNL